VSSGKRPDMLADGLLLARIEAEAKKKGAA
jgi:hypothetical protein